ncbi:MAG TPA: peptidase inhibitor family I36 protein [Vicinamibacterales bacterium]|nr:peptidase inhibitor family I36 protein [Vicinamibacterales bacterium]
MTSTRIAVAACAAVLAVASAAEAQRWGYGRRPRDGACFYEDRNFGGQYFCVDAGANLPSIPQGMSDRISSLRVFGRAEVTIYRDYRFNGRSTRFTRDVRDLRNEGWNDAISSLDVRGRNAGGSGGGDPDRIVRRAYDDILEREPDSAGLRLYRSRIVDDGWTEAQVRDALRRSPEYQKLMADKAREIVRRAYLNVLKREPDAGAGSYVDKVVRQRWTQADVERELRKSPEYRARGGR